MNPDHYYLYAEVCETLRAFVRDYPELCRLHSIGKTFEGRDILCLTICDRSSGEPETKPAFYMDGNLHSGEVASSMAVLYTLDQWLSAFGKDPVITELLKRCTVYAIPRINCDAAEITLTSPRTMRGSAEPYYPEEGGIQPCDLDRDGEIRQMRITDPAGQWKAWPDDPRVMLRRAPDDTEGPFYTLVSEGIFKGTPQEFASLHTARPREDLDPNRQFPFEWNKDYPDPERPTSGPEPLHDREVQALHDFVCGHPNIVFHMNFHTFGGLHISPAVFCPHLSAPDGAAMRALGLSMRKQTGYRCEGIFPEGAKDIAPGSFTTWEYFEKGVMAFVTELWDFHFQADPERPESWSMFFAESEEQELREAVTAIHWDEINNEGRGFKTWQPYDHPQWRGTDTTVEIGGWSEKFSKQNPPVHLLESVCQKGCAAALTALKAMPCVRILRAELSEKQKDGAELCVTLANTGFLPTSGTEQAAVLGLGDDLTISLSGCGVLSESPIRVGKMAGFSKKAVIFRVNPASLAPLTVTVQGSRCGRISRTFSLSQMQAVPKEGL